MNAQRIGTVIRIAIITTLSYGYYYFSYGPSTTPNVSSFDLLIRLLEFFIVNALIVLIGSLPFRWTAFGKSFAQIMFPAICCILISQIFLSITTIHQLMDRNDQQKRADEFVVELDDDDSWGITVNQKYFMVAPKHNPDLQTLRIYARGGRLAAEYDLDELFEAGKSTDPDEMDMKSWSYITFGSPESPIMTKPRFELSRKQTAVKPATDYDLLVYGRPVDLNSDGTIDLKNMKNIPSME